MKASELIAEIQRVVDTYGDLPVFAENGMDPSDYCLVTGLELVDRDWVYTENGKDVPSKVICICA